MQTTTRLRLGILTLAGMCGTFGCGSMDASTKAGDLGNGRFKYACVSDFGDDSACGPGTKETFVFPTSLAVGGSFKLGYEPNSGAQSLIGNAVLKPASVEFVSDEAPGLFLARKAGRVAIVARSSSNGKAADITYLRIAQPTEVRLRTLAGPAPSLTMTMHPSDSPVTLRAEAYSGSGTAKDVLAGTIEFVWTSSSEAAVKLVGRSPASRMQFQPVAAGTSVIQAKLGDQTATVNIEVTP